MPKISRKMVQAAYEPINMIIAAHLDLEGFAYVKIIRTGPDACFFQDVTERILEGKDPTCHMTKQEISKAFWAHPAYMKDWTKP